MPPGALGTALRSTTYFDGAAIGPQLVALCAWALAGLGLLAYSGRANQQPSVAAERETEVVPA